MTHRLGRVLFLLFFLSGFCGLLYQIVWIRLAFASFGVITPNLSIILSVFMLGIAVGSALGGWAVRNLTKRFGKSALFFYGVAELAIGAGAFLVPMFFHAGEGALVGSGETDSVRYLFSSAVVIAASIFPFCVAMGVTYPFVMAFVKESATEKSSFSYLYTANVVGAMFGTLITPGVLVELFGFRHTLLAGAVGNALIGVLAIVLSRSFAAPKEAAPEQPAAAPDRSPLDRTALAILFTTGFVSMAMEVAWTRAFTVIIGTEVYAFALLLFVYLLATFLGSAKYRFDLARGTLPTTGSILGLLAATGLLPIVCVDPRFFDDMKLDQSDIRVPIVLLSIAPFCALLGYLTPRLVDELSGGDPDRAGRGYSWNVLGCILGPLAASYLTLPTIGARATLILLALPIAVFFVLAKPRPAMPKFASLAAATLVLLLVSSFVSVSYEERAGRANATNRTTYRDYTATVTTFGKGKERRILVNGVGITGLIQLTSFMAHIPLALHEGPAKNAAVICFGMGTTYRALMSWGIDVTAVELVPSVVTAFPFFHSDAKALMKQERSHIVVDDGRRFMRRTTKMFDVITIDPPPPTEAAGSGLLYSDEFYALLKQRLAPGGILQQWFPNVKKKDTMAAVARSLLDAFPYVRVYIGFERGGAHFVASMSPIPELTPDQFIERMPEAAKKDLLELSASKDLKTDVSKLLANQVDPKSFLLGGDDVRIADDRPFNEYYWLRRNVTGFP